MSARGNNMIIKCRSGDGCCCITNEELDQVAEDIMNGELIIYPTETVYGIGTNIFDEAAVKKIYIAKNRPFDMPLSVAVSDKEMAEEIAFVDDRAEALIDTFMPGPLTIIIKKRPNVPDIVTSMSEKVGIRIPDHSVATRIVKRAGPIITTSANRHSRPDAVRAEEAMKELGPYVKTCIDCGPCTLGKPSTIVWLMGDKTEIVRQGAITKKQIEDVLDDRS
jgi:L-threonylcarbamoyladenylate synthase